MSISLSRWTVLLNRGSKGVEGLEPHVLQQACTLRLHPLLALRLKMSLSTSSLSRRAYATKNGDLLKVENFLNKGDEEALEEVAEIQHSDSAETVLHRETKAADQGISYQPTVLCPSTTVQMTLCGRVTIRLEHRNPAARFRRRTIRCMFFRIP